MRIVFYNIFLLSYMNKIPTKKIHNDNSYQEFYQIKCRTRSGKFLKKCKNDKVRTFLNKNLKIELKTYHEWFKE